MGHSIHAFLFRGQLNAALAERLPAGALCPLTQGVIALALPDDFEDELEDESDAEHDAEVEDARARALVALAREPDDARSLERPDAFIDLDHLALSLAARLADGRPFAYVETNYFGGAGEQNAALWRDDALILPSAASARPVLINEVLKFMGVIAQAGVHDEFEAIGLHVMRTNDNFAAGLEARLHRVYGLGARGRYLGPSGFIELRARDDRIGRWDPERERWLPWRVTVAGALIDSETERVYTFAYERSGTPGLLRQGEHPERLYYNDGPSLVHDPTRAAWSRHVGMYQRDSGQRVSVRMDKRQLYLEDTRLLPVTRGQPTRPASPGEALADDHFVTARRHAVEFAADALLLRGLRYRRV